MWGEFFCKSWWRHLHRILSLHPHREFRPWWSRDEGCASWEGRASFAEAWRGSGSRDLLPSRTCCQKGWKITMDFRIRKMWRFTCFVIFWYGSGCEQDVAQPIAQKTLDRVPALLLLLWNHLTMAFSGYPHLSYFWWWTHLFITCYQKC